MVSFNAQNGETRSFLPDRYLQRSLNPIFRSNQNVFKRKQKIFAFFLSFTTNVSIQRSFLTFFFVLQSVTAKHHRNRNRNDRWSTSTSEFRPSKRTRDVLQPLQFVPNPIKRLQKTRTKAYRWTQRLGTSKIDRSKRRNVSFWFRSFFRTWDRAKTKRRGSVLCSQSRAMRVDLFSSSSSQATRDWENRRQEYEDEIKQLRAKEAKQERVVEQLKHTYDDRLAVRRTNTCSTASLLFS